MRNRHRYRDSAWLIATMVATVGLAQSNPPAARTPSKAAATVAVRGINGIKGPKLINLERALQLQHAPPPPPAANSNAAALLKGPPGPPAKEPTPPRDERQLLDEVPPDQIGGS